MDVRTLVIKYCVVAVVAVLGMAWWTYRNGSLELPKEWTRAQRTQFHLVLSTILVVFAPLFLPVMVVAEWSHRKSKKEFLDKFGHHVEVLLQPLHAANISDELAAYINEHDPTAMGAHFERLGAFWLKPEPYNGQSRLYLSHDQMHFGEVGVTMGVFFCELISFLEDGSMIGTANCDAFCEPFSREENGFYINSIGASEDMQAVIESHCEFVELVSSRASQPLRRISRENWREYFRYHNRKYGQVRFERGEAISGPESCEFPPREPELVGELV